MENGSRPKDGTRCPSNGEDFANRPKRRSSKTEPRESHENKAFFSQRERRPTGGISGILVVRGAGESAAAGGSA
ncbi:hypothetical protein EHS39_33355 [Ensifer sp. MPMI2T]|nr:hypothetical protein EHS39_33355 [Ensifer sp. MPMI2T]